MAAAAAAGRGRNFLSYSFRCCSASFFFVFAFLSACPAATPAPSATSSPSPTIRSSSITVSSSSLERSQALALLSLKRSLQDPSGCFLSWRRPFSSASNPCTSWRGVSCTTSSSSESSSSTQSMMMMMMIISLDISSCNLSGTLPPSTFSLLPSLLYLNISNNRLSGPLPRDLPFLPNLISLNISNNLFSGPFPSNNNFSSPSSSLRILDAFNNNFGGPLPLSVTLFPRLAHLHLGGNFFTGSIPPQISNLARLQYLALSGNNLSGRIPAQLGTLRRLRFLYLGYFNLFQGSIPMELGSLSSLQVLDLSQSGLSGLIPSSLASLPYLHTLFLQNNTLLGSIPPELGRLANLKSLDLSNNRISGVIPDELCRLSKLEFLALLFNRLHGNIPRCLGDLPNLQVLKLFNNNLTGSIPEQLGRTSLGLRELDLSDNGLTGPIPPDICKGGNLEWLLLLDNQLSGEIPASLADCKKLTRIRMGNNRLSGPIPSPLFFFPNLDILELSSNQLQGPPLPDFSSSPSVVAIVNLAGNRLSGPLTSSIANMTGLEKLDLSNNMIDGSIPRQIGLLSQVSAIDLSDNLLVGSLPEDLSRCSRLSSLNLSRNNLCGAIPASLQSMKQLVSVDLSFNNFSGVAPSQEGGSFTALSLQGNPFLCGPLVSKPCDVGVLDEDAHPPEAPRGGSSHAAGVNFLSVGVPFLLFLVAAILLCAMAYAWSFRRLVSKGVDVSVPDLDIAAEWWKWIWWTPGKKTRASGNWKLVRFEALDLSIDHVLACLKDENIIGQGGTGTVYKGVMPGGRILAVKRLPAVSGTDIASASSRDRLLNDYGFSAEIQTLANVSHRHIVKLLGWCSDGNTNLLLYDYMPNGSLGELLHGSRALYRKNHVSADSEETSSHKKAKEILGSWQARVKVALGAAEGLSYLHHDCFPPILHRDVKPNNILLDSRWEAKVADFGLAKPLLGTESSMSVIAGSYGYMAPEYAYTFKVNEKSDVYSYGVVLLELLTGRKPIGPEYGECVDIVKWARGKADTEEGRTEMVDPRIRPSLSTGTSSSSRQALLLLFAIAMKCVEEQPENRPSLRDVIKDLKCVINSA